jgi:thiamine transport system ATP-binding protein
MLTLENLLITQGDFSLRANWSVAPGQIVALIGPSGEGKSTLLSCMAGFLAPSAGHIVWSGARIETTPPNARPFAMVFQDHNLFPHLDAYQNVALGRDPGLRLTSGDRADIDNALAQVGLAGLATRKPAQLSGGQQGRVALARVLVQDRPIMLLDEPFAALGPALRAEMLELVRDIAQAKGATVLMVTHNPDDARHVADQVILVAQGQAQAPRPTEDAFSNPDPVLKQYMGI